jgi:hypothetical protein
VETTWSRLASARLPRFTSARSREAWGSSSRSRTGTRRRLSTTGRQHRIATLEALFRGARPSLVQFARLAGGLARASSDFRKRCLMAATRDRGAVVSARRHVAASAKRQPAVVQRRPQRGLAPGRTDALSPSTRTRCTSLLHSERRPRPGPTFPDDDRESCRRVWAPRKPNGPQTSRERP